MFIAPCHYLNSIEFIYKEYLYVPWWIYITGLKKIKYIYIYLYYSNKGVCGYRFWVSNIQKCHKYY